MTFSNLNNLKTSTTSSKIDDEQQKALEKERQTFLTKIHDFYEMSIRDDKISKES